MNRFVTACMMVALSLQLATTGKGAEPSAKRNVLMICIDDLNDWTGFLAGHPEALTPHMDALAKRGRIFANAHCAVPVCSASRVSVMSGVAATTHGSYELGPRYEELPALTDVPTIQRYFRSRHWRLIVYDDGTEELYDRLSCRLLSDGLLRHFLLRHVLLVILRQQCQNLGVQRR